MLDDNSGACCAHVLSRALFSCLIFRFILIGCIPWVATPRILIKVWFFVWMIKKILNNVNKVYGYRTKHLVLLVF